MPFTPLHMGPGLAVKAVMQRKFSLLVFGWSQVVIDLQPLHRHDHRTWLNCTASRTRCWAPP
jgi:hypothetical protein